MTRPRDSNPRAAACVVTYLAARRRRWRAGRRGGGPEAVRRCGGPEAVRRRSWRVQTQRAKSRGRSDMQTGTQVRAWASVSVIHEHTGTHDVVLVFHVMLSGYLA